MVLIKSSPQWLYRLAVICAAGFVATTVAVSLWPLSHFDHTLLTALRNPHDLSDPLGPGWVEEMGRDFTALGAIPVLALLTSATGLLWLTQGQRQAAITLVCIFLTALLLSTLAKWLLDRPRPELVAHATRVYTASLPSAHAFHAMAVYLSFGLILAYHPEYKTSALFRRCALGLAILLATIVGTSRLYLGVHWPTDILAGWFAGAAVSFAGVGCMAFYCNKYKKGTTS